MLVAGPSTLAPSGVLAAPPPDVDRGHGAPIDPTTADGAGSPSVHYRQDLEHAGEVFDFEPGGRVDVPFSPRAGDAWEVDGRAPRALPSGHATGKQMHEAAQGSDWAAGRPYDATLTDDPATTTGALPSTAILASTAFDPVAEANAAAPIGASGLRREVFGFLPYWEVSDGSTVLDWRVLSTVAYFSVGCTSSGSLAKKNSNGSTTTGWAGWTSSRMTSIINSAHQNQTRVVLTISCFAWTSSGATIQANLLGSATARSNLAKQAAAAVRDRGADGINLDFEPIVAGYADEFTLLVRSVRAELNAVAPGYQLTFDTLGSIGNQPIAEATAPGAADAVFIMGYDYRLESSSTAGSISPLTGPRYDLNDTIKAYAAKVSPSKLILGVPYYGRAWSTSSDAPNAPNISGAKYGYSAAPPYEDAVDYAAQHGRRYDSIEQAPWTAYHKQTCTSTYGCVTAWRELYYDDAYSLRLRYDLVNRMSLRGAGIWALGYDGTHPELRTALADKFLADKTPPVAGVATLAQTQRDEGFRVAWTSYDDSTVAGYDVQVSIDGGAWASWLTGTTQTSSIYLGADGHTYAFRVRGTDIHGNVSAWILVGDLAAPASIEVGGFATVLADGLRMRAAPATDASTAATLAVGDALRVTGGPATADGYTWYQVNGPVRQWAPVDPLQVGVWVAASGSGTTNLAPRTPVYATRVDAGLVGLALAGGGQRVLTPNGDGVHDTLSLAWTNTLTFDSLTLRINRADGTLAGTVPLAHTAAGAAAFEWDGRIGGTLVPDGTYVIQLQAAKGSTVYSAPSLSPVSPAQLLRFGVVVGQHPATAVRSFKSTATSPTKVSTLTYALAFGGPVSGLAVGDLTRGGTATGCVVGAPTGAGAAWTIAVTGCSGGTVTLALKAAAVADAVGNLGPATPVAANAVLIDRTAPTSSMPRVGLRTGLALTSTSISSPLLVRVNLAATDPGGAGVSTYDVARSYDGRPFETIATGLTWPALDWTLKPAHSYRFQVRARDKAGNVGPWVAGPTLRGYLVQQTSTAITWTGTWKTGTHSAFSGGSERHATAAGASARYSFTGRGIAWVTTRALDRGVVKVYIDGVLAATVDSQAPSFGFRHIAFSRYWSRSGYHTIKLVVVGSPGHPRVDIDAFEILR